MKLLSLFSGVGLSVLVGCVHTTRGTKDLDTFDPSTSIVKGQTSKEQLMDRLGTPQNSAAQMDGTELDEWTMAQGTAVIAPFYRNRHVSVRHLKVTFKDGVAQNYTTSDSESF